jgi:tRNA modification GTPase
MGLYNNDTIAAISTSLGPGGIGIVRISGSKAVDVARAVFRPIGKGAPGGYKSHTIHYGHVKHPGSGDIMDEALMSVMLSPRTYTREDVVEISCHGGGMSLKKTLDACLFAGARIAEPGEFTERAFLNGRIDLAQAEAVMDIITAETEKAQRVALGQLGGGLSAKVEELREALVNILALLELSLDFSQEDIEAPSSKEISEGIKEALKGVAELAKTACGGMMLRSGLSVVICGKPNVGKSSLMNALLRHDRVIVAPIAGTTRDVVEESIDLNGFRIRLSDTAGIVDTRDRVEMEGIRRSREKLSSADLVIFMIDPSSGITGRDKGIYEAVKHKKTVIAVNKTDLGMTISAREVAGLFGCEDVTMISALKSRGLEELEKAIARKIFSGEPMPDGGSPIIANARHRGCIEKAETSLRKAVEMVSSDASRELVALDIGEAVHHLGLIIGKSIEDDVIKKIFSEFCIGK